MKKLKKEYVEEPETRGENNFTLIIIVEHNLTSFILWKSRQERASEEHGRDPRREDLRQDGRDHQRQDERHQHQESVQKVERFL
jgi:hypothetical protein